MDKKHISLWIDEDTLKKCDANIKLAKVSNRSEYISEAIEFYNGYLHGRNNEKFVGKTLMKMFQGTVDSLERRISRQLFKQSVEIAKVFWLVVRGFELRPESVDELHQDCIEEVKTINGAIRYPYKIDKTTDGDEEDEVD